MSDGRPATRYRLLSALAAPLLLAWVARVAWRLRADPAADGREWRRFVRERLGVRDPDGPSRSGADAGARPWLHCASVGEVLTALPLIEALAAGGKAPLVTTATPTGARVLAARAPLGTCHRYLPIDRPGPVARFLDAERPTCGGIVETELWPWLFARAKARGVPLFVLSGRLSARTVDGAARALAPVYRDALAGLHVLARSEADAQRFRALCAGTAEVSVAGDLKDAASARTARTVRAPSPVDRRYALAASTHADEESRVARAWLAATSAADVSPGNGAPLLVIAPRHPDRADEVHAALRALAPAGTGVARRSLGQAPTLADRLYLADTLGELDALYAHAAAAFVGGSLVERGGHNLLEPARLGLPCVTGTHTANFADVVAELTARDALVVAADADGVAATLARALAGDAGLERMGRRAREVATRRAGGVLARYLARFPPDGADGADGAGGPPSDASGGLVSARAR